MNQLVKTLELPNEEATGALGQALAVLLGPADVILLRGDLGAGKTSLARGIISTLCEADEIPSPTYTLVQTYQTPIFEIWHFDLYRLEDSADIWELGIEEALEDGVCLIEWPERIEKLLNGSELTIEMKMIGRGRKASLSGNQLWGERLNGL